MKPLVLILAMLVSFKPALADLDSWQEPQAATALAHCPAEAAALVADDLRIDRIQMFEEKKSDSIEQTNWLFSTKNGYGPALDIIETYDSKTNKTSYICKLR